MSEEQKDKINSKGQTAKEIAEIMAANMNDPNFIAENELLQDKIRAKIVKERKLREERKNI